MHFNVHIPILDLKINRLKSEFISSFFLPQEVFHYALSFILRSLLQMVLLFLLQAFSLLSLYISKFIIFFHINRRLTQYYRNIYKTFSRMNKQCEATSTRPAQTQL